MNNSRQPGDDEPPLTVKLIFALLAVVLGILAGISGVVILGLLLAV